MGSGKYHSLEEARRERKLDRFCKEHPSEADRDRFERLLDLMTKGSLEAAPASDEVPSEGSSGTRTRRGTSKDADG